MKAVQTKTFVMTREEVLRHVLEVAKEDYGFFAAVKSDVEFDLTNEQSFATVTVKEPLPQLIKCKKA